MILWQFWSIWDFVHWAQKFCWDFSPFSSCFYAVFFTFKWSWSDPSHTSWSVRAGHTLESDNFGVGVHVSIPSGGIWGWRATLGLYPRWFGAEIQVSITPEVTLGRVSMSVLPLNRGFCHDWCLLWPPLIDSLYVVCQLTKPTIFPSGEYPHLPQSFP